jgi:hypothetical protein
VGCYPPDPGRSIPVEKIYFPVGIAVSPGKSWMYVANSNFDLQFSAGSVQVYDLARVRELIPTWCWTDSDCSDGKTCDTTGDDIDTGNGVIRSVAPTHRCIDEAVRNPCASLGTDVHMQTAHMQTVSEQSLTPGLCTAVDPTNLLVQKSGRAAVKIGSFATDVIYATNPLKDGKGGRLFIPVRGDATVHWIDADDDTPYPDVDGQPVDHRTHRALDCGQGDGDTCDSEHRRGTEPAEENTTNAVLPTEPYGIALQARPYGGVPDDKGSQFAKTMDGQFVSETVESLVTTHQTTGEVALFINSWSPSSTENGPQLQSLTGGLPPGALSVASVPLPAIWVEYPQTPEQPQGIGYLPSFLTTFRNAGQVNLVRTFDDAGAQPARPFIEASRAVPIRTNSTGFDSRGIAVDSSVRTKCEATDGQCELKCDQSCTEKQKTDDKNARFECLLKYCVPTPFDVYVANRTPASLIVGHTPPPPERTLSDDLPRFTGMIPMSVGPSRVIVGDVLDEKGRRVRRVFVVCFDSRRIFVFDPEKRRFEAEIITGRGPHAFALDVLDKEDADKLNEAADKLNEAHVAASEHAYAYVGMFSDSYIGVVDLDQRHVGTYGTFVLSVGERTPPRASK